MTQADQFEIRPMDLADYDASVALWHRSDGVMVRGADSRPAIERYLERNPGTSFVALANAAIVGTILAGTDLRRGIIHHLAVNEDFRGRGIATQLVEAATTALRGLGIEKCTTYVFAENGLGRAFWDHLGWDLRSDLVVFSGILSDDPNA